LLRSGDRVVVALSGGPDSTALLAALKAALPLRLVAAHLDHGLRDPAACERDRASAEAVAGRLGVPFESGQEDTRAEAKRRGTGSLEAAARAVRYRFLGEVADRHDARIVAVGHTASDQAETVLMRIVRGTGLRGLGGMPRKRRLSRQRPDVLVVRPLLDLTRDDVLAYVADRELPVVHDASNDDPSFTRNRIRQDVLPLLRAVGNPEVDAALLRLADQARAASRTLDRLAGDLLHRAAEGEERWDVASLRDADPAVRSRALSLLVSAYAPARAAAKHVHALERVLRRGGATELPGRVLLRAEDGLLRRAQAQDTEDEPSVALSLEVPGQVCDEAARLRFSARVVDRGAPGLVVEGADPARVALLDAERAAGALAVRRRRAGDRFWPLGAPGRRSLKRFFIDQKVPRHARGSIPVVTLDGRPVWVVGHRIDDTFRITPTTARVLELRVTAMSGEEA
jgi:tRNA(Ile)-lysidine synthase